MADDDIVSEAGACLPLICIVVLSITIYSVLKIIHLPN